SRILSPNVAATITDHHPETQVQPVRLDGENRRGAGHALLPFPQFSPVARRHTGESSPTFGNAPLGPRAPPAPTTYRPSASAPWPRAGAQVPCQWLRPPPATTQRQKHSIGRAGAALVHLAGHSSTPSSRVASADGAGPYDRHP